MSEGIELLYVFKGIIALALLLVKQAPDSDARMVVLLFD